MSKKTPVILNHRNVRSELRDGRGMRLVSQKHIDPKLSANRVCYDRWIIAANLLAVHRFNLICLAKLPILSFFHGRYRDFFHDLFSPLWERRNLNFLHEMYSAIKAHPGLHFFPNNRSRASLQSFALWTTT
jgi:hypothetical protein